VPHQLLLADDSITIQRVIELTFADEDVEVVAVGDGDQAIARLDERPPDIVLADVGMPGRNGYEIARYIRDTPRLAHIPVLLLTGAFEPVDQIRVSEVGCQGILAKPFEPQHVIQRVRELLADPSAAAAVSSAARADAAGTSESSTDPQAESREPADMERYFEELDKAFTTLTGRPSPAPAVAPPASPAPATVGRVLPDPAISTKPPASQARALALADAFAALLSAEQSPADPSATKRGTTLVPDALVEEIVQRVLERLSDRVVRDVISDLVLDVAERLVREEIARIRAQT
jgi:CheY-like chemotaxis protein